MSVGKIPIVPWVRCADPKCDRVIAQWKLPWSGDPIWIRCHRCGAMNRISTDGVWIVDQAGEIQPVAIRWYPRNQSTA